MKASEIVKARKKTIKPSNKEYKFFNSDWDNTPRVIQATQLEEDPMIISQASKEKEDMVNHPPHYTAYAMEVIDIMEKMLTPEEFKGYLKGNILKYRLRAGLKGSSEDRETDLAKSNWYQDKLSSL